jgi:transposase InsO family protein
MAADKQQFFATGIGDLRIRVPNGKSSTPVILHDALYAPEMALTVISINRITKAGYSVSFEKEACKIKDGGGKVVGVIPANSNRLYHAEHVHAANSTNEVMDVPTLHRRMGHIAVDSIHTLVRSHAIQGISLIDNGQPFHCKSCEYAKTTRKAIKKECEGAQASTFGEEIHTDLWGPSLLQTLGGRKYYITFTDDYSRSTRTQVLKSKDEALQAYKDFAAWAQTQHGAKIKRLRSDHGGEYTGDNFSKFLKSQGTERRLTTHDTPQHNSVAKSLNRHLL